MNRKTPKRTLGLETTIKDAKIIRAVRALRKAGDHAEADRLESSLPADDYST